MAAQTYRKKPVEIQALQWDGSDDRADNIFDWTARSRAMGNMQPISFVVLGEPDSYAILGDDEVRHRLGEGFSAAVYDELHGTWVNLTTGDWVIRGVQGEFYPCRPDVFEVTYDAVLNQE